jgi:uncharacterized protein YycO
VSSAISFPDNLKLYNGDLIFRRGRSIESQIVLLADRNSIYSHVGMVHIEEVEPFVVHSVPAENGDEKEFIKMEKVEDFLSKEKAARFAVFRLKEGFGDISQSASEFVYDFFLKNYRFDNQYDLLSDKNLYCTELIWKAYQKAGVDLVQNRLYSINFIVVNKKMILPSSIIESNHLKLIYSN